MKKRTYIILLIVFSVLTLAMNGFIFFNSILDQSKSSVESGAVTEVIKPVIEDVIEITAPSVDKSTINYHGIVRKLAHFSEFAMLAVFASGVAYMLTKIFNRVFVTLPMFYVLVVAVLDEFIQTFSDRAGMITDVLIDYSGALLGFLFSFVVILIIEKVSKKKKLKLNQ